MFDDLCCFSTHSQLCIFLINVQKMEKDEPVKPDDAKIFNYITGGIACHSNFLPSDIQQMKELLHRKSEVHVQYCFVECPKPAKSKVSCVFVVRARSCICFGLTSCTVFLASDNTGQKWQEDSSLEIKQRL